MGNMHDISKILYLTMDDVKSIGFSDHDFINCISDVFVQYGQGNAFPLVGIDTDLPPDKIVRLDSGCVEKSRSIGLRWTSGVVRPQGKGVSPNPGVIILSDSDSGLPNVIMDAYYLSAKCSAATHALAARFFARKNSEVLSILGTDQQALYNLQAMSRVLKQLKEIRIYDHDGDQGRRLAKRIEDDFHYKTVVCANLGDTLKNADVIVDSEACGAELELIPRAFVPKNGVFIVTSGVDRLAGSTIAMMDKIVTDSPLRQESFEELPVFADLGEVSTGKKPGREHDSENIWAVHRGNFVAEMYTGQKMAAAAKEKGIGIELAPITW